MGWVDARDDDGQATPEYVGIVLLVAALFGLVVAVTPLGPASARLAREVAETLVCAVTGDEACSVEPAGLGDAYGAEIAALVRDHAPEIRFEDADYVSLPVDPRDCRDRRCADTSARGPLRESFEGQHATAFVRAIDCRDPARQTPPEANCDGDRAGNLYFQYWLYYPDSATRSLGRYGYHPDDWESFQVRVGPDGSVSTRASSHHSYNSDPEALNVSDVGHIGPLDVRESAWGPSSGYLWVSDGSHAGRTAGAGETFRSVRAADLRLIPIETNLDRLDRLVFEDGISPPWLKEVFDDPESKGT
jgi:hypothetical protein